MSIANFTFNIPVELHNINPDANSWFISVLVCDSNWADGANLTTMIVGEGRTTFEVENGEYSGTITVVVNAQPGRNPSEAAVFRAELGFRSPENPVGQWAIHAMEDTTGKYGHDGSQPFIPRMTYQMPGYTGFTRAPIMPDQG